MSTPPEYTSRTVPHDDPPPPYSRTPEPTATRPSSTRLQQSQRSSQDTPLVEYYGPSAWAQHTCTLPIIEPSYSYNSSDSSSEFSAVTRKSRWQRLKEENEVRKAKTLHVTHEQAAKMVGRDEEWLKERGMGTEGEHQWVRKGNSRCVVM